MGNRFNLKVLLCGVTPLIAAFSAGAATPAVAPAQANGNGMDAVSAVKLAKSNRCLKCHSTFKKKKEGPSYPTIAARYKDDPDAVNKLVEHITSGKNIKRANGMEEHHKTIMNKSPDELRNLAKWILAE